jgi:hypothetical protein
VNALRAAFLGPQGTITVDILTRAVPPDLAPEPRVMAVRLTSQGPHGGETLHLARPAPDSPAIRIEAETCDSCRLPRLVESPELDPAQRVAAALESSRIDPPFQNALPIALWLLEAAG